MKLFASFWLGVMIPINRAGWRSEQIVTVLSDAPNGNGRFLITEDADSSWGTTKQDLLDSLIPLETNSAPAPKR